MVDVIVYTKDYCPYCSWAKKMLDGKGVKYTEINIEHDIEKEKEMKKISKRTTVPQILIDGTPIGGFTDMAAIEEKGELDELLGLAPISGGSGTEIENVVILGTGPAGLTAAIYAARAELKPLVIDGTQPGGQLTITTDVENYPGFPDGVQGPEMMDLFRKQAERFGTRIEQGHVSSVDFSNRPFTLTLSSGIEVKTKAVIISTGASARWLGIPGEQPADKGGYGGRGVSACATCDGFFFKDQEIAVVGGGDTAMEETNFLTKFAKKVYLIHRRDEFRASKIMQQRVMENEKVEIIWNSVPIEVLGDETAMTGLKIKSTVDEKEQTLPVTGFFVAIGHTPNSGPFKGQLDMDEEGYLIVKPGTTETNVDGVFAAGDIADKVYRQAITAAGLGCMAAIGAERYLSEQGE